MRVASISSLALAIVAVQSAVALPVSLPWTPLLDLATTPTYAASILHPTWSAAADVLAPRLVQTSSEVEPSWRWPLLLRWRGISFFDVTDHPDLGVTIFQQPPQEFHALTTSPFPSKLHHQDAVAKVHANLSQAGPRANIKEFTSFRTRYYKSSSGRDSQLWLFNHLNDLVARYGRQDDVTVTEFTHPWAQNSVIVRLQSHNHSSPNTIVLGCHQDSVNLLLPLFPAPGADDDRSGVVTQLESLRALLATGYKPSQRHIEYHFYSGEEAGLLGSAAVSEAYVKRDDVYVDAMSQFDMTAFVKAGTRTKDGKMRMGLVDDFVSPHLTEFNKLLIREYLGDVIDPLPTTLGYAASDHASWTKVGAHSAFTVENKFDDCNLKRIHTTSDTWDHPEYSFDLIQAFTKLSTAFAIELSA